MTRLKCPQCATIVDVQPGVAPVCPNCGFGSTNPPAAAPASPAASTPATFDPSRAPTIPTTPPGSYPAAPTLLAIKPSSGPLIWGWILYGLGLLLIIVRLALDDQYPSLALVNAAIVIVSVLVVAIDANRIGVGRLRRARIRLSSTDRTAPATWAIVVLLLWVVCLPWYLSIRSRLARRVAQADAVGYFPEAKQARKAQKANKRLPEGTPLPAAA